MQPIHNIHKMSIEEQLEKYPELLEEQAPTLVEGVIEETTEEIPADVQVDVEAEVTADVQVNL